jgi:AcrR family transcriptional regulator
MPEHDAPRLTSEQRRAQLISAARDVFIRHGLSGARTRTIAEYAGVSEALLYQHFPSKEALFEAAILGPLEQLTATLAQQCAQLPSLAGPQRRSTSVDIHAAVLSSMTEIAPLLGLALFSKRASGKIFYTEQIHPMLERTVESVSKALAGWEHAEVSPSTLVSMIFGTYYWVGMQATFTDTEIDVNALASEVTDLLVRAVKPQRPPG